MKLTMGGSTQLCPTCRRLKPWREFKWAYKQHAYCSQPCLVEAMKRDIPSPRSPHD